LQAAAVAVRMQLAAQLAQHQVVAVQAEMV
jgi:hypothetical protein